MNFIQAVEAMEKGHKVTRKNYKDKYFKTHGGFLKDQDNDDVLVHISEVKSSDWEIVEEKKTLSDKIVVPEIQVGPRSDCVALFELDEDDKRFGNDNICIKLLDVKTAIEEFIKRIELNANIQYPGLDNDAKEIFGSDLI